MRVLVIQQSLSPPGGGNAVAAWMVHALANHGYDVTTVTESPWTPSETNAFYGTRIPDSVERHITPAWQRAMSGLPEGRLTRLRMSLVVGRARALMPAHDLSVTADNFAAFDAPGIQYVHFPALIRPPRPPLIDAYFSLCDRIAGKPSAKASVNLTLVNSRWTGERLTALGEIGQASVLYPPVIDPGPGEPWAERARAFLCVGRFHPSKRIETVVNIVRSVRDRGMPDARLVLVGSTVDRAYTAALKQLTAGESWIKWREDLDRDALNRLMGHSQFAIQAMVDEHFGMATAELARAGCLVFAHDSGGTREVLNGAPELLWRTEAEAVDRILAAKADTSERLRAAAERFSSATFVERFLEIVRRATSGGGTPHPA